mgnify:CR=1 FL=1
MGLHLNFIIENVNNCISKEECLIVNQNSPIIVQLIKECERILDGLDYIDANCLFTPTYFEYPSNALIISLSLTKKPCKE